MDVEAFKAWVWLIIKVCGWISFSCNILDCWNFNFILYHVILVSHPSSPPLIYIYIYIYHSLFLLYFPYFTLYSPLHSFPLLLIYFYHFYPILFSSFLYPFLSSSFIFQPLAHHWLSLPTSSPFGLRHTYKSLFWNDLMMVAFIILIFESLIIQES